MKMKSNSLAVVTSLSVLCAAGCMQMPCRKHARTPKPLPESIASQIKLERKPPVVLNEWERDGNKNYRILQVELESFVLEYRTNKTLTLEVYLPHGAWLNPTIMILPISAGDDYFLERYLARYFSGKPHGKSYQRYASIIVHRESEESLEGEDPKLINITMRQSVADNQRVLDWIETRPEFDPKRIGVNGTSMGAIKGSLLMACDPRVRAASLCLVGGDIPYILAYSKEGCLKSKDRKSIV